MKTVSPGIRQKDNGKFIATKSISGQRYYEEFDKLSEAKKWKRDFHPLFTHSRPVKNSPFTASDQSNGKDKTIYFGEVLERYQVEFLRSLEPYTQYKKMLRLKRFTPNLIGVPMCAISPSIIASHLGNMKLVVEKNSKRCNFDKELKDLSSIFNWYHDNVDFTFSNPVTRVHYKLGKIKEIVPKKKTLTTDQLCDFFEKLKEPFQTLAVTQFLMAGRIQEAAAVNDRTVDFNTKEISVSEKIVWLRGHPELHIGTKTGETGVIELDEDIELRLLKLKQSRPSGCKFFFHKNGKPLRYDLIRKRYNEALELAGLNEFSGTHILRHSMAKIARMKGGPEACMAMLRHRSMRMSEIYGKSDSSETVSSVISFASELLKRSQNRATKCDQDAVSN